MDTSGNTAGKPKIAAFPIKEVKYSIYLSKIKQFIKKLYDRKR